MDLRIVSCADIFQWWNQHSLDYQLNTEVMMVATHLDVLSILAVCHLVASHVCLKACVHGVLGRPCLPVMTSTHPAQLVGGGGVLSVHSTWKIRRKLFCLASTNIFSGVSKIFYIYIYLGLHIYFWNKSSPYLFRLEYILKGCWVVLQRLRESVSESLVRCSVRAPPLQPFSRTDLPLQPC